MSGHKAATIEDVYDTIRENYYERRWRAENELNSFQHNIDGLRSEITNTREHIESQINDMELRAEQERSEIKRDLLENRAELQRAEKEIYKKIEEESARTDEKLAKQREEFKNDIKNTKIEFDKKLEDQREEIQQEIDALEQRTEENLREMDEKFTAITNENRKKITEITDRYENNLENARDVVRDVKEAFEEMDRELQLKKYQPEARNKVVRAINSMSVNENAPQAAIAEAKERLNDLLELQEEAIRERARYNILYEKTLKKAEEALDIIEGTKNDLHISVVTEDGKEEVGGKIDVNYWTDGKYLEVEEKLRSIRNDLKNNKDSDDLSTENVGKLKEQIDNLMREEKRLAKVALERCKVSQLKANIGDVISEKMGEEGFTKVRSGYEGLEDKKSYYIKFKNKAGTEVVTVIESDDNVDDDLKDRAYNAKLSIDTKEENLDEEKALERIKEIRDVLNEAGLAVGDIEEGSNGGNAIEELFDEDKILKERGELPKEARMIRK